MSRLVAAGISGFLAHQLVFLHGEWHLQAPTVVTVHLFAIGLVICWESYWTDSLVAVSSKVLVTVGCYLLPLYTSIVVYRVWFHRLRHFPGPRLAAVSKLWHVWQCRDSRNHLVLESLRQEYGPFVRTGERSPRIPL